MNVADLKVTRDDDLSQALAEVAAHAPVLAEAGFVLDGLDVEVSPVQRIIVQLVRFDDIETLEIQALIQKCQQQKSVRAILSAILKARAMVETVHIDGLDYHKLTVGIGPIPTIRLCWRDTATDVGALQPAGATPAKPRNSSFEAQQGSFFGAPPMWTPMQLPEPEDEVVEAAAAGPEETATSVTMTGEHAVDEPEPVVVPSPPPLPVASEPAATPAPPPAPPPLPASDPADPLAKFKVMPNLSR